MTVPGLRSPYVKTRGLMYFARMLDKIRLHAKGSLPSDYHANLGEGFDKLCAQFLRVNYADLAGQANKLSSDEAVLDWCEATGRKPDESDFEVWNEFMRKRGWNDGASERLRQRKAESGFANRDEIQTFFDYIDADEGRPVGGKA
jgi:gluconokinase